MESTTLLILNFVFYVVNTVVTYGSQDGWFGETNTVLSKKYQTLVTPRGWAFAIWGLIFIAEGLAVAAPLHKRWRDTKVITEGWRYFWISACVWQCCWTVAFAQEVIWLSLVFMLLIWVSLAMIVFKARKMEYSIEEFWLFVFPFQVHIGWISAASFVNLNVVVVWAQKCYKGSYGTCATTDNFSVLSVQLGVAVISLATLFVFALYLSGMFNCQQRAITTTCGVLAWAYTGIQAQLQNLEEDKFDEFLAFFGGKTIPNALAIGGIFMAVVLWVLVVKNICMAFYCTFMKTTNNSNLIEEEMEV